MSSMNFGTKFIDLIEMDSKLYLVSRVDVNCNETTREAGMHICGNLAIAVRNFGIGTPS